MRAGGERGQATVEWIGLALGLALAFGGALGAARGANFGEEAGELGEALAKRVTCGVRGACAAGAGGVVPHTPRVRVPHAPPTQPLGGRGVPPITGSTGLKRVGGGALRALGKAGRLAWPVCLGARRLKYELDNPRTPRQGIPIQDTLSDVNQCLNPVGFLLP